MSIWNRILVVLVSVSRGLHLHGGLRGKNPAKLGKKVVELRWSLDKLRQSNQQLVEADRIDKTNLGTARAKRELHRLLLGRGRVWSGCSAVFDRATEKVAVTTDQPTSGGITVNMTLYAVQDAEAKNGSKDSGRYVGEFKVEQVGDRSKFVLAPAQTLDKDDLQRLANSPGPWTLYEVLPADRHDTFRGLGRGELAELLPRESLAEYEKDGQPATRTIPRIAS